MVGFEKVLGAVKVIKDQIQYRSQSLLNLARDYFSRIIEIWSCLLHTSLKAIGDFTKLVNLLHLFSRHLL